MGNNGSSEQGKPCIFCQISQKNHPTTTIHTENEKLAIFSDHNPASKHHYLIVPKEHLANPKTLYSQEHIDLIKEMVAYGTDYLKEQGGDDKDMKVGFHWPPFTTVDHLHLHVIYPASAMTMLFRIMYADAIFVSPEYVIDKIKAKL